MMTETHINSNHMLNSGLGSKSELEKMDDVGWKSKLRIPPRDKRIKTSVSFLFIIIIIITQKKKSYLLTLTLKDIKLFVIITINNLSRIVS